MRKELMCPTCHQVRAVDIELTRHGDFVERRLTCRTCRYSWVEAKPRRPKRKTDEDE